MTSPLIGPEQDFALWAILIAVKEIAGWPQFAILVTTALTLLFATFLPGRFGSFQVTLKPGM